MKKPDLKYESRLEFGTNSNPSRTAIWDKTRTILINGLPQRPSTPVVRPAPVVTNQRLDSKELYPCSQKMANTTVLFHNMIFCTT